MLDLNQSGWLAAQPEDFRKLVMKAGRWRSYQERETLYEVGEAPSGLFGLAEGAIDLAVPLQRGELITVYRAEPGFWIGDSALLAKAARVVSVHAAMRSRILCVPGDAVRDIVHKNPEHWRCFYELSHMNVTRAISEYVALVAMPPRDRLLRLLARLGGVEGRVSVTQAELATLLGANRSSVQRALDELVACGAVARGYGFIQVLDRRPGPDSPDLPDR